jgi:hypothetical protein
MNPRMVTLRQHQNGVWYVHYSRRERRSLGTKDKAKQRIVNRGNLFINSL